MMIRAVALLGVVSTFAWAQRAPAPRAAPGQCSCNCVAPRVTLEPAAPVAQCTGVLPPATCPCECNARQALPANPARPSSTLTAEVAPLVRQGRVVVAPDVHVSGPRGAVFVIGASFRDDSPRAAWSPWVTTERYAVGPTGHVSWENFSAAVPDDDFGTPRFQVRVAVFDMTGRIVAETSKTLTARPAGYTPTVGDMQFDNARTPAGVAAQPTESAADFINRLAAAPSFTLHSGPRLPHFEKAPQQMRITYVRDAPIPPNAPDLPLGTYLEFKALNADDIASRQALAPGASIRYEIAMSHCSAAAAREGKPTMTRPNSASVAVRRQLPASSYEFAACAKEGSVTYTATSDGRLYVSLDAVFTDGSRVTQSFWLDTMSCGPNPPCL